MRIYLYDSTLRDGGQTQGVDFSATDKAAIAQALDRLGIDYIEGGWPGANPTDDAFFAAPPSLCDRPTILVRSPRSGERPNLRRATGGRGRRCCTTPCRRAIPTGPSFLLSRCDPCEHFNRLAAIRR